jgi:hypothetical protein
VTKGDFTMSARIEEILRMEEEIEMYGEDPELSEMIADLEAMTDNKYQEMINEYFISL